MVFDVSSSIGNNVHSAHLLWSSVCTLDFGEVTMILRAFNVRLNDQEIDTIFWQGKITTEEVKQSLVDHDGYDPNILVIEDLDNYIY